MEKEDYQVDLFLLIIIVIIAIFIFAIVRTVSININDFLTNLLAELVGILITVGIITVYIRKKREQKIVREKKDEKKKDKFFNFMFTSFRAKLFALIWEIGGRESKGIKKFSALKGVELNKKELIKLSEKIDMGLIFQKRDNLLGRIEELKSLIEKLGLNFPKTQSKKKIEMLYNSFFILAHSLEPMLQKITPNQKYSKILNKKYSTKELLKANYEELCKQLTKENRKIAFPKFNMDNYKIETILEK